MARVLAGPRRLSPSPVAALLESCEAALADPTVEPPAPRADFHAILDGGGHAAIGASLALALWDRITDEQRAHPPEERARRTADWASVVATRIEAAAEEMIVQATRQLVRLGGAQ